MLELHDVTLLSFYEYIVAYKYIMCIENLTCCCYYYVNDLTLTNACYYTYIIHTIDKPQVYTVCKNWISLQCQQADNSWNGLKQAEQFQNIIWQSNALKELCKCPVFLLYCRAVWSFSKYSLTAHKPANIWVAQLGKRKTSREIGANTPVSLPTSCMTIEKL